MLNIFRRPKKNVRRKDSTSDENIGKIEIIDNVIQPADQIQTVLESQDEVFARHIYKYIGSTVTIFVSAGGSSGLGFTGVLISSNSSYVRLLTQPGPPPACSIYSRNPYFTYNTLWSLPHLCFHTYKQGVPVTQLGSIACIPIDKIVCFAHNSL